MKRQKKTEESFLEQLEKVPNISLACEKLGLSRNTIYRWRREDDAFNQRVNNALTGGILNVNDLAESKLIGLINQGSIRAITYWLENNNSRYCKPNLKEFREKANIPQPIASITFHVHGTDETIEMKVPKPPQPPPADYP